MSNTLTKPAISLDLRGMSAEDKAVVTSIFDDLAAAGDRIKRAAQRWVRLDDAVREQVTASVPMHYREFLGRLQRIGEGSLHPQLYAAPGRAAATLGRLPMEAQERFLSERIPVAVVKAGANDILRIDVLAMDDKQRRQVFKTTATGYEVRSISEQRAWLRDEEARLAAKKMVDTKLRITRAGRWYVENKRAFIDVDKAKTGLTRGDVVQLLKDLEA